jgi:pyroglutamyl-peptidase
MTAPLLITTFTTWKPEQPSNASDDLIQALIQRNLLNDTVHLLRQVQVDFELAPATVLSRVAEIQPAQVVCCGMAEGRSRLTLESNGKRHPHKIHTPVDVHELVQDLAITDVSHDAGEFVCNHLYYSVLNFVQVYGLRTQCLFVHVPILHQHNMEPIVQDFATILNRLQKKNSALPLGR